MAKEPEATHEAPAHPHPDAGTNRPGFSTSVTDAPDHNANQNPNTATPSQRVQDEQAAGRAAIRDGGRVPGFGGGIVNPADADPALAAELAQKMNAEHEEADRREARAASLGSRSPGDVPSRGMPPSGLMEGDELLQGTPDHRTQDPRLLDKDSDLAREGEARKEAQQAEEPRVREQIEQIEQRDHDSREREQRERDQKDKQAQHERATPANKPKK